MISLGILLLFALLHVLAGPAHGQCEPHFATLVAADGTTDARFGWEVALDGDTALIGAEWDDERAWRAGAVYVCVHEGGEWGFEQKLLADDGEMYDVFGCTVALDGDTAVVGAFAVDGAGEDSGAAYVFEHDGTQWTQVARLVASDAEDDRYFGFSAAIQGGRIAIGAPEEGASSSAGSVYIFERDGSGWNEVEQLTPADGDTGAWFGVSVALDGSRVVTGAPFQDTVDHDDLGAVYVFRKNTSGWVQEAKLVAADGTDYDQLGNSVAIDRTRVLASSNAGPDGKVYVFERSGGTWQEADQLLPPDLLANPGFGTSLAIDGPRIAIGAPRADWDVLRSGAVYTFVELVGEWWPEAKLTVDELTTDDMLGVFVALEGDTVLAGALQADGVAPDTGGCYFFDATVGAVVTYCDALPNSSGNEARIAIDGSQRASQNDTMLLATGAAPESLGLFIYAGGPAQYLFGNGYMCLSPWTPGLFRIFPPAYSGETGAAAHVLDFGSFYGAGEITAGSTWYFQYWFRDVAAGGSNFNLTDGMRVSFCP